MPSEYNFNFAMSVSISETTIRDMIKDIVEKQTGQKVDKITFRSRTETTGYGPSEYSTQVFDGVTISFVDQTPRKFDLPKL